MQLWNTQNSDNKKQQNWGKNHLSFDNSVPSSWQVVIEEPLLSSTHRKSSICKTCDSPKHQQHTEDTQLACPQTKHAGLERVWPSTKLQGSSRHNLLAGAELSALLTAAVNLHGREH